MPVDYIPATLTRHWITCPRLAWFTIQEIPAPIAEPNRFEELLAEAGTEHEQTILAGFPDYVCAESAEHTKELIRNRTPVIYQPIFKDEAAKIIGIPDFLILQYDGHYRIADAKLCRSLSQHPEVHLQLALYQKLYPTALPPLVFLGSGETAVSDKDVTTKLDQFLADVTAFRTQATQPKVFFSDSKCRECAFDSTCRPKFIEEKELSLVYGIDSRNCPHLIANGITNFEELANADPSTIPDLPHLKGIEKKQAAVTRAKSLLTGQVLPLAPCELPGGTWIHFDVEVNPLVYPNKVYLWGLLGPPYDVGAFTYTWGDGSEESDERAWLDFLAKVEQYRAEFGDIRFVHYSDYERIQIKAYAERFQMEDHPTVVSLLGPHSILFDLRPPVRNSFALPTFGYGLKAICKDERVVNFQWELKESGSQWSVVRYAEYLEAEDESVREGIKAEILSYNRDDVRATWGVEGWVRGAARR